jgi:protein TonB
MNEPPPTEPDLPPRPDRSPSKDRRLSITLSASLGLHLIAVLAILLLLRAPAPAPEAPEKPAEVELVMEEHQGDLTPPTSPPPADAEKPAAHADPSPPVDNPATKPPIEAHADTPEEVVAPPQQSTPDPARPDVQSTQTQPAPAPPAAQPAPTITLSGTDSPSDARAFGDHILPAQPDAVFHNKPPVYPVEAALAGQHGAVIVIVHISPAGRTAGVDVVRSSGYVELDQSAIEAVMRWRFLPAVRDGQPVESAMTMQFYFDDLK